MFVIGIFAFFMFIISLFVCAFVLIVQYLIIRRKIHQDKRAVNFRAKYATLSTFFYTMGCSERIQPLACKPYDFFTGSLYGYFTWFFVVVFCCNQCR